MFKGHPKGDGAILCPRMHEGARMALSSGLSPFCVYKGGNKAGFSSCS